MSKPLTEAQTQEIADLVHAAGEDGLFPEDVVNRAKRKTSALHDLFEWDTERAAEEHWITTARRVIQRYHVTVRVKVGGGKSRVAQQVRGLVSVGDGYQEVSVVMRDPTRSVQQLLYEWRRIEGLLSRLETVASLNGSTGSTLAAWAKKARESGSKVVNDAIVASQS